MRSAKILRLALLAIAMILLFSSLSATAETTQLKPTSEDGILVFASDDGEFKWWVDTRIYLDTAFYVEDKNSLGDGVQLRRGRMAWKGIVWSDWYVEFDLDFAEEATEVKDAYIRFDNISDGNGYVRIGNFRAPFGLEENTTSRYIMFQERSLGTDAFMFGRRMGLEVAKWTDKFRIAAGIFGPDVEDFETTDEDVHFNFASRLSAAPINEDGRVLHVGGSFAWRQPTYDSLDGTGGEVRFRTREESHVTDYKYLNTGYIKNVDNFQQFGGELAFTNDRLMVQTEFVSTAMTRIGDFEDLSFSGAYAFASFFLTDDTHPYDHTSGEFGKVLPNGEKGALEFLVRYSVADMNDKDILGGKATSVTAGLTWYANPNIKVYSSYTAIDNDMNATAGGSLVGDDDYGVFQMRFMAAF
jgi:phosphate-selective porin OprO/OprP